MSLTACVCIEDVDLLSESVEAVMMAGWSLLPTSLTAYTVKV